MTTSLAQKDYLTTLSNGDTITFTDNSYMNGGDNNTIDLSSITLTNSGSGYSGGYTTISTNTTTCIPCYPSGTSNAFCFTNGSTINVSSIDMSNIWSNSGEEWIHKFPDFDRIEKMCKEYPGLAIAFEKFKTVYKLVADDYDTPKNKRAKP